MKKKILLMAVMATILAGCKPNEPEEATPTALFSSAQNELTVTFTNASQNAQSYLWAFGDGKTSKEKDPVHTYAQAGTYNVQLTATNITKSNTYSQNLTISQQEETPTANFSYTKDGLKVTFSNSSTNAQSYVWAFGDGQTSTEKNPIHTFAKADTYNVQLTATNKTKSNTFSQSVTISQSEVTPTANFSYGKNELTVTFSNSSTNAQSFQWEFGDGQTSTLKNPSHTYSNYGTYNVTLTASNGSKTNATSQSITLTEIAPQAGFTYKTEHPLKVVLTNTSSNATSYEWNFGDGTTSKEENPTHKYKTMGIYKVKLIAKSSSKSDTYETEVQIKAPETCIITGFSITKIPTNNKYYQVQLTDDYWIDKTTYYCSKWFMLNSSANIPFYSELPSAKTISIEKTYVARLYKYTGTGNPSDSYQADGKGDWTATVSSSALKAYPDSLSYSNSTAGIKLFFQWK